MDRTTELNKVYNFNAINLNIHPSSTMHQRLSQCALAGGFMLYWITPRTRTGNRTHYFELGREVVLFQNARDLVDKCRHYLAHPASGGIAMNFRKRAFAERTATAAAGRVLDEWRKSSGGHCRMKVVLTTMPRDGKAISWITYPKRFKPDDERMIPLGFARSATNFPEGVEVVILDPPSRKWTIDQTVEEIEKVNPMSWGYR